jgi:hypothetical protein
MLISWKQDDSTRLRLAKDDSLQSVVKSAIGGEVVIAIGSQDEVFLPVIKSGGYDQIDPDNSLLISLRWRFAQPRMWNADRNIRVWVRKRDLDYMIDNYMLTTG